MFVFVVRRVLLFFPVLFGVLIGTFAFIHYGPGDPLSIMFGEDDYENDPEILARLRKIYGLDRAIHSAVRRLRVRRNVCAGRQKRRHHQG